MYQRELIVYQFIYIYPVFANEMDAKNKGGGFVLAHRGRRKIAFWSNLGNILISLLNYPQKKKYSTVMYSILL